MKITKLTNGKWVLRFRPHGANGRDVRKQFDTRGEAERFYKHVMAEVAAGRPWNPKPEKLDDRLLSDLVHEWHAVRGFALLSSAGRVQSMLKVCRIAGEPLARHLDLSLWADIRSRRAVSTGVTVNTLNHDLMHFKGMFTDLIDVGKWPAPNPLASVKKEKIQQQEMAYLSPENIVELFEQLQLCNSRDPYLVAKLCLATGARWREAESVTIYHLKNGTVYYPKTKNGKSRTLPIDPDLERELLAHRVPDRERLFSRCYDAFTNRLKQCSFTLPKQQAAHVLRHTFASSVMQNGGNIRALQEALGHADLETTMVYAHFAPKHMEEMVKLNPLAILKKQNEKAFA